MRREPQVCRNPDESLLIAFSRGVCRIYASRSTQRVTNRYEPEVPVTPGITHAARAPGDIITVMPGVCPTPYRARSTVHITRWPRASPRILQPPCRAARDRAAMACAARPPPVGACTPALVPRANQPITAESGKKKPPEAACKWLAKKRSAYYVNRPGPVPGVGRCCG